MKGITKTSVRLLALTALALPVQLVSSQAQTPRIGAVLPGAGSGGPISISADKLDYFDKEQKLVYSGKVEVKQGSSMLKASALTIFLSSEQTAAPTGAMAPASTSQIRHMDAAGPVVIISEDQIGTGDKASYEQGEKKVRLSGNVTLTRGSDVQTCNDLTYDLNNNMASCVGRVTGIFTPGGSPLPGNEPQKPAPKRP
jgi:lipopolysaccharide export system protein LptA